VQEGRGKSSKKRASKNHENPKKLVSDLRHVFMDFQGFFLALFFDVFGRIGLSLATIYESKGRWEVIKCNPQT
jgi:hypothetical protein